MLFCVHQFRSEKQPRRSHLLLGGDRVRRPRRRRGLRRCRRRGTEGRAHRGGVEVEHQQRRAGEAALDRRQWARTRVQFQGRREDRFIITN